MLSWNRSTRALDNIRLVRRGGDPRRRDKATPTVIETVKKIVARDAPTWRTPERTARDWRSAFRLHAHDLALRPVDKVTSAECTAVLGAIWHHHRSTASKLRQRLGAVFKLVVADRYRSDNPVDAAYATRPRRCGKRSANAATQPLSTAGSRWGSPPSRRPAHG